MKQFLAEIGATLIASAVGGVTTHPPPGVNQGEIVVQGQRKALRKSIADLIEVTDSGQLARYESEICPGVVGLSDELAVVLVRIIRRNIQSIGGRAAPSGCDVNAIAIFTDRPHDLVLGLRAREPSFFDMTPGAFKGFASTERPAYSWQLTDTFGPRGQILRQLSSVTYQDPNTGAVVTTALQPGTKMAQDEAGSRLTTAAREEIELSFVAIDRDLIEGRTMRQLADFATLHLMLSIKPGAGVDDPNSILSLFAPRSSETDTPLRMSQFDRGVLRGFYTQRYNNRSAAQQRQNIVEALKRGAAETGN